MWSVFGIVLGIFGLIYVAVLVRSSGFAYDCAPVIARRRSPGTFWLTVVFYTLVALTTLAGGLIGVIND